MSPSVLRWKRLNVISYAVMPHRAALWKSPLFRTLSIPSLRHSQTSLSLVESPASQHSDHWVTLSVCLSTLQPAVFHPLMMFSGVPSIDVIFLHYFNSLHGSVVLPPFMWRRLRGEASDVITTPSHNTVRSPLRNTLCPRTRGGNTASQTSCGASGYYSSSYRSPWFIRYSRNTTLWVILGSSRARITACVKVFYH